MVDPRLAVMHEGVPVSTYNRKVVERIVDYLDFAGAFDEHAGAVRVTWTKGARKADDDG